MKTQHTPGPWREYRDDENCIFRVESRARYAETVANVLGDDASAQANARLIAAAPELLEAAAWAEKELAIHAERDPMCARLGNVLAHVRAAIARAEGRE